MPQIRDSNSVLIAEASDVLDLALIANEVGADKVVFDDVGPNFNFKDALEAAQARAEPFDVDELTKEDRPQIEQANELNAARAEQLTGPVAQAVSESIAAAAPDPEVVSVDEAVQTGS